MAAKRKQTKRKTTRKAPARKKSAPKRKSTATRKKKAAPKRKAPVKRRAAPKKAVKRRPVRTSRSVTKIQIPETPVKAKWNPYALGYTVAIVKAASVLLMSLFKPAGMVEMMQNMLFSYSSSVGGVIAGMAEAGVYGLIGGFVVAWLYNKFQ